MFEAIIDSWVLLPALGCPSLAYPKRQNGKIIEYKIFAAAMILHPEYLWHNLSEKDQKQYLAQEFAWEEWDSQYDAGQWPDFGSGKKIVPGDIEFASSADACYKASWQGRPGFKDQYRKDFWQAYLKRSGARKDPAKGYEHCVTQVEFVVTLPQAAVKEGQMYNLISRAERTQLNRGFSTFYYLLRAVKGGDARLTATSEKTPVAGYHPFYILHSNKPLNIAHLTDTHVARRWDAMEYWAQVRLTEQNKQWGHYAGGKKPVSVPKDFNISTPQYIEPWSAFNNPNRRFEDALEQANNDSDVQAVVITGDIIDYFLGFFPNTEKTSAMDYLNHTLSDYKPHANWLLFYELLLRNYKKPVFTILGNHDYRQTPYGPFINSIITRQNYTEDIGINIDPDDKKSKSGKDRDRKAALELIYPPKLTGNFGWDLIKTSYDHTGWYNYAINPALDYAFEHEEVNFLFFDWGEKEKVGDLNLAQVIAASALLVASGVMAAMPNIIEQNKKLNPAKLSRRDQKIAAALASVAGFLTAIGMGVKSFSQYGCPWAENVLSDTQKKMTEDFLARSSKKALVLSMHSTVFSGADQGVLVDDASRDFKKPEHLSSGNLYKNRYWLVEKLIQRHYGLAMRDAPATIVLTGHAHALKIYRVEGSQVVNKAGKGDIFNTKDGPLFVVTDSGGFLKGIEARSPANIAAAIAANPGVNPSYYADWALPSFRVIVFEPGKVRFLLKRLPVPDTIELTVSQLPKGHPYRI